MILIHAPEGGERRIWNLKENRFMGTEAEAVERPTGLEWQEAKARAIKGSMLALRAIVWVLVKRDEPTLPSRACDPAENEIGADLDAEEWGVLREELAGSDDMSDAEKAIVLAQLDAEAADAAPAAPGGEEIPKDSDAEASPTAA